MTDKLNPEQRRRVAEACRPGTKWGVTAHGSIRANGYAEPWWPETDNTDWKALVCYLADKLKHEDELATELFVLCVANNNTEALERMVFEVLEAQDG